MAIPMPLPLAMAADRWPRKKRWVTRGSSSGGYADACVADSHNGLVMVVVSSLDRHAAGWGEFERVREQVGDDVLDPVAVARRGGWLQLCGQRDVGGGERVGEPPGGLGCDLGQVVTVQLELHFG